MISSVVDNQVCVMLGGFHSHYVDCMLGRTANNRNLNYYYQQQQYYYIIIIINIIIIYIYNNNNTMINHIEISDSKKSNNKLECIIISTINHQFEIININKYITLK